VSVSGLLAEVAAAGIQVTRDGDNLRVRVRRGTSLAPYMERITANKPALLRELLQRQIVQTLDVDRDDFDRPAFDALWVRWHTQDATEDSTP
jgi:hypothetical protein